MNIVEYLRQEIAKNEELQKLFDLASASEQITAEIAAHKAKVAEAQKDYQQAIGDRAQIIEATVNLKAQYSELGKALGAEYAEAKAAQEKAVAQLDSDYRANEDALADALASKKAEYESAVAGSAATLADYAGRIKAAKDALDLLKRA